jgi:aspartate/methionine/tyrosine aminotransferase
MPIPFREVIAAPDLATGFADTAMMSSYLDEGSPAGELIYLGFGESWTEVAPGLVAALARPLPTHSHGYVISQYGLPRLQRTLRSYIATSHRLPTGSQAGRDFEVAVASGGTRNAMFDFARLLQRDRTIGVAAPPGRVPILIAPQPGWDYAGIVEGLGYRTQFVPLRDSAGYQPLPEDVDRAIRSVLADPKLKLALVVINAQHNPTGANWNPDAVRHIIRRTLDAGAAILLDDAYFGVHDPGLEPTSALAVLLKELDGLPPPMRRRWLAVRSLGKQFHCSGWGIGAVTASPETLDTLLNSVQLQRSFATAMPLQEAMATWLTDVASSRYLDQMNQEYAIKRAAIAEMLRDELGYPPHAYQIGRCGAFARIQVPPAYQSTPAGVQAFREECFRRTGVLVGVDRWSGDLSDRAASQACFRIYLGPPLKVIAEGLSRLAAHAGYRTIST